MLREFRRLNRPSQVAFGTMRSIGKDCESRGVMPSHWANAMSRAEPSDVKWVHQPSARQLAKFQATLLPFLSPNPYNFAT